MSKLRYIAAGVLALGLMACKGNLVLEDVTDPDRAPSPVLGEGGGWGPPAPVWVPPSVVKAATPPRRTHPLRGSLEFMNPARPLLARGVPVGGETWAPSPPPVPWSPGRDPAVAATRL